ncbi:MFS transporter [Kitasatospora sp. HPMI-4]|uniref:MFS transporter n=1 Tax=Kitasatospora sp. HPMI-4 TaxID=3448443 RepID=UPI003F1B9529
MSAPTELPPGKRRLVLAICCVSVFVGNLGNTVLTVALPAVQRDLRVSLADLQWTVDAYLVVLAALLLLSGSVADRFGRRRTFVAGLALFTLGSLLCSLAPGLGWLVAFRALQAVGGSMLNPVAMSIITNTFPEPRARARAIGVWGAVLGVSMAVGPPLGGVLVQTAGWRSVFWLNPPIGLAAIWLTVRHVPESRAARPRRLDAAGQLLVMVLLGCLTYAIIEAPGATWPAPSVLGCAAAVPLALLALVVHGRRRPDPLIEPAMFRNASFSGASVMALCSFFVLGGFLFLNTLYLQGARGMSALATGLYLLPLALMNIAASPLSGRLTATRGPRTPLLLAGAATTAGALLPAAGDALLLPSYLLLGLGAGLAATPITNAAMAGLPRERAGVAAGIVATGRQLGQALGVAVLGAVLTTGLRHPGVTYQQAMRPAYGIMAACGLAIVLLALLTTRPGATPRPADRASEAAAGRQAARS